MSVMPQNQQLKLISCSVGGVIILSKIIGQKARLLPQVARTTLVKSVANAIPTYIIIIIGGNLRPHPSSKPPSSTVTQKPTVNNFRQKIGL